MRPQQLHAFIAVAQTRHFTQAAENLGVTQPSLSKQIQALETELGTPLFTRTRSRIELTDAGHTLLPHARQITAAHEAAHTDIDDILAVRTGRLRLGATPSLCSWLIAPLLTRYREDHPHVTVTITEDGSGPLTEHLAAGDLDLAFTIGEKRPDTGLTLTPLLAEALVVASAPHLPPLTHQTHIGLPQLREQHFILPAHGYDLRDLTITTCNKAGFTPRIAVDGGATDAVASLVEAGLGIALLPAMIAATTGLRATPLAPPGASRTIALAARADTPLTKAASAFAECLHTHLTDLHAWGRLPEGMRAV